MLAGPEPGPKKKLPGPGPKKVGPPHLYSRRTRKNDRNERNSTAQPIPRSRPNPFKALLDILYKIRRQNLTRFPREPKT